MDLLLDNLLFDDDDIELYEYINYQRRPYIVYCRINNLLWDNYVIKVHFRLSKETVLEILNLIQHYINTNTDR
jgi:hypothetical protein